MNEAGTICNSHLKYFSLSWVLITVKYSRMTYREDKLFTHQISELDFLLLNRIIPKKSKQPIREEIPLDIEN